MAKSAGQLILGEFRRAVDERFRVTIPSELIAGGAKGDSEWVLAKERPGCLSLWGEAAWHQHQQASVEIVQSKLAGGRLQHRTRELQTLGRLLSTRHRTVQLSGRSRLLIPEGFREFLNAEPGGELIVIGAAVCIELWAVEAWKLCLEEEIPRFGQILEDLGG